VIIEVVVEVEVKVEVNDDDDDDPGYGGGKVETGSCCNNSSIGGIALLRLEAALEAAATAAI
jgi:hypothetical protein